MKNKQAFLKTFEQNSIFSCQQFNFPSAFSKQMIAAHRTKFFFVFFRAQKKTKFSLIFLSLKVFFPIVSSPVPLDLDNKKILFFKSFSTTSRARRRRWSG